MSGLEPLASPSGFTLVNKIIQNTSPDMVTLKGGDMPAGNSDDYTLTAWVRVNGTADWRELFQWGETGRYPSLFIRQFTYDLHFKQATDINSDEGTDAVSGLQQGQWAHVAFAFSSNDGTVTTYINGKSVDVYKFQGKPLFGKDEGVHIPGEGWVTDGQIDFGYVTWFTSSLTADDVNNVMSGQPVAGSSTAIKQETSFPKSLALFFVDEDNSVKYGKTTILTADGKIPKSLIDAQS